MNFNERIKGLRLQNSITQKELGEKIGVSTVTIRNWESGLKQPSMQALVSLSDIFNTSVDYLIGITNRKEVISPVTRQESSLLRNFRMLDNHGKRLVSRVCEMEAERFLIQDTRPDEENLVYIKEFVAPAAAGYAAPVEGDDYELIPWDSSMPGGTDFAVRIQGDSMAPYINDGDVVFVKECNGELDVGDVGIFCVDGATYCKIFYEDEWRNITLVSANPDYKGSNVYISKDSGMSLTCFGKVLLKKKIPMPDYFEG